MTLQQLRRELLTVVSLCLAVLILFSAHSEASLAAIFFYLLPINYPAYPKLGLGLW